MNDFIKSNGAFDDAGLQYVWDSTSLNLADTCPRKYQLRMIYGWQPLSKSVHLLFGGWYATALEHFYKHLANGMDREDALREVVREALVATWIEGVGPWETDHPSKTRFNLIRTIVWYVDHFAEDSVEVVHLTDGTPAVEYSFTLPIDNDLFLAGHIDRLVQYSSEYYVMDQKTSQSTISSFYFEQFSPDIQMSLYTFAGKAIYDLPVKGVIIDAAQIAVGFSRFERGFTFRTAGQLDEWYDKICGLIENVQRMTRENHFPMREASCGNYGGCEFRAVCSRAPEVRDNFLKADFARLPTWDPTERR